MKLNNIAKILVCATGLGMAATSCDYLDVVPPEKASVNNTMDNYNQALGFLYNAYRGVTIPVANDWAQGINQEAGQPLPGSPLSDYNMTTDEWIMDDIQLNNNVLARAIYSNTLSANNNFNTLKNYSIRLSIVFLFLEKLNTLGVPNGVVPEDKAIEWRAEAKFLIAYYHYCMLRRYGPIAIVDNRVSMDATIDQFPGRMHYDYCVDWICKQLDEAAADLPAVRPGAEVGRATSTICKALKARIRLYAASPLFNGQFPYPEWTNKVETPGYGTELISKTYDRNKWVVAKDAAEEALALALGDGERELYYGSSSNETPEMIEKTFVPVDNVTDEFKTAVLRMRNVICAKPSEGNREGIWLLANMSSKVEDYRYRVVRNPVPKNASILPQGFIYAYGTVSATLATVLRFGTKDGYQPANDPNFPPESDWYRSAGYSDDGDTFRSHIINLNKNREPRFYAWLSFDGGDYGTLLYNGQRPVYVNMLSSEAQGYDPVNAPRDGCATGWPSQKWINPKSNITTNGKENYFYAPRPFIRLAELYLDLAECYAELGDVDKALENINIIRRRAGATELTAQMVNNSGKSIVEWARDERSVELYDEMHRYFDVRRWCQGELLGFGQRKGLNSHVANPTFAEFNKPGSVNLGHVYSWGDRMYLHPIDAEELYSNPQFVQSPGY